DIGRAVFLAEKDEIVRRAFAVPLARRSRLTPMPELAAVSHRVGTKQDTEFRRKSRRWALAKPIPAPPAPPCWQIAPQLRRTTSVGIDMTIDRLLTDPWQTP